MKTTDNIYNKERDAELDRIRLERLDRIIELEAQRDAAVAALRDVSRVISRDSGQLSPETASKLFTRVNAAIAAAERSN